MGLIEAAGGVVVDLSRSKPRYLLIHRNRFDDWSMPKGKLHKGEKHRQAALREVKEETGYDCEILGKLSATRYQTPNKKQKKVRYWLMTPSGGEFIPNDEVDAITWLKRSQAMTLLTYMHDQALLVEAHLAVKSLQRERKRARKLATNT